MFIAQHWEGAYLHYEVSSFGMLFGKSGGVVFNNLMPCHGGHHADGLELLHCLLIALFVSAIECHENNVL